jgi:hypothetical protein
MWVDLKIDSMMRLLLSTANKYAGVNRSALSALSGCYG